MAKHSRRNTAQRVRIIGGMWRGRVIALESAEALRPTPNRVRETLFNWLGPSVSGARCLDMFAGSGALGIEALSRGAAHCDFVETDPSTASRLRSQLRALDAEKISSVLVSDALTLSKPQAPWDIIFVDPPFSAHWVHRVLDLMTQPGYLTENADIYIETSADDNSLDSIPPSLHCWRDKRAGAVRYALLTRE